MPTFLQLSIEEQKLVLEQAAARKGWAIPSVEKDYWVCWTLQHLFALPSLAGNLTFKGGTSLSKAYGLIDRFSEDIDLTIGRDALGFGGDNSPENAQTTSQQDKRLKKLREACSASVLTLVLPELRAQFEAALPSGAWTLEPDSQDNDRQTLLFTYPTLFADGASRYVHPSSRLNSAPDPTRGRRNSALLFQLLRNSFQASTATSTSRYFRYRRSARFGKRPCCFMRNVFAQKTNRSGRVWPGTTTTFIA